MCEDDWHGTWPRVSVDWGFSEVVTFKLSPEGQASSQGKVEEERFGVKGPCM